MMRFLAALAALLPLTAFAGPATPLHAPAETAADDHHAVLGAKLVGLSLPGEEDAPLLVGPGLLFEYPLAHGALTVEAAAAYLFGEHGDEVPVDLLLKVPFHVAPALELFVGAGPLAAWSVEHDEIGWGGLASVGGYWWTAGELGLLLEADYEIVRSHEHTLHGVEAAAGVVWRL
ncbi:MAG: hypothetical protein H6704_07415 [Myxococcales bacterium]|nr:hypothetical protein [Myxococcales bacterium]